MSSHLRLAFSVGVVGGFALGAREALVALHDNSFVQIGQYFWLYLVTPVLLWMALGVIVMVPCGLAGALGFGVRDARAALAPYAAVLAAVGALSITLPWTTDLNQQFHAMGLSVGVGQRVMLIALNIAAVCAAAAFTGAAAAWYAARVARPLRVLRRCLLLCGVLMLVPVVRFVAGDWKWRVRTSPPVAPVGADLPNGVLISIDTLRADHVGAYGDSNQLTPHLDQLARDGVLFERAITSSPWTLPAMASVMTGLDARHHTAGRITNRRDPLGRSPLSDNAWTLPAALHARGYRTHAIVTNPYLALRYGLGEGFDSYENVTIESEAFLAFGHTTAVRLLTWLHPDLLVGDRGATVSERARRWLESAGQTSQPPFFLWLHYVDPHPPYSRAEVNRHKSFRGDSWLAPRGGDDAIALTSPDVARLRSGEIRLSPDQKDAVHALYRAEVASVDAAVGSVLQALDEMHLRDRTLVVLLADHGEEFWDHGGVEHGHTLYDELLHVPLIERWPGRLPAGQRVSELVRVTDIAPTILDLLGVPPPTSAIDGASLLPLIDRRENTPRIAVSENLLFAEERVAVRTLNHKYVRWQSGKEEVYDLMQDPTEQRDLAGVPGAVEPLRQLYSAVNRDAFAPTAQGAQPTLDATTAAALRSLGYLQ